MELLPKSYCCTAKKILIDSAIPIKGRNRVPGSRKRKKVKELSLTGAEINLPAALRMAQNIVNP